MLPGDFSPGDVVQFVTRVTVNGVTRPVDSVSLDCQMRSDLPSQISRSSSMSRSGTVQWATNHDVTDRPLTAFRDFGVWRPQKGDRIIVYVGDGDAEWRRFTGLIDETTGSVGAGMESTIVADTDGFSREFSTEGMLTRMPPREGSSTWRIGGLSAMVLVDEVLRGGGRYITPRSVPGTVLNVPLQNTMRPAMGVNTGTLISGGRMSGTALFQADWPAWWGFAAGNFQAQYEPVVQRSLSTPTHLSVMVEDRHSDPANVTLRYGGHNVRLVIGSARTAVVQATVSGTLTEVCRLTTSQFADAYRAELLIKNGRITLRANNGAETSGALPSGMGDPSLSRVEVNAWPEARIAGIHVYHPPTTSWEWSSLNHVPSARILSTWGFASTWLPNQATPRIEPRSANSVLEDLADQTLSALWVDEEGTLIVAPSGALRRTEVSQSITTADDVLGFAWSDRLLASASEIVVHYDAPRLSYGMSRSIEVARGSRKTIADGDIFIDTYSPSADEDWYAVDTLPRLLPGAGWENYNHPSKSYVGGTYYINDESSAWDPKYNLRVDFSQTGISEFTVVHEGVSLPSNVVMETQTHPDYPGLWSRNRGENLPVLRAWGKAVWTTHQVSTTTNRPGPVLNVDLGRVANVDSAEGVRDHLRGIIENAHPQITSLPVTPDPRRQLGDHLRIRSRDYLGVTLRVLITGMSETITEDGYEQSLDLDVLEVDTGTLTYEEWEQAFPGTLTYEQWRTRRDATDTYDDFNTDPLKGAN